MRNISDELFAALIAYHIGGERTAANEALIEKELESKLGAIAERNKRRKEFSQRRQDKNGR